MKILQTLYAIFLLGTLSSCQSLLLDLGMTKREFKVKPVSTYEAEGVIFSEAINIEKFEKDYVKQEEKKLIECKIYVEKEGKKLGQNKEHVKEHQNGCNNFFSSNFLRSKQWLDFRNQHKKGDEFHIIGKKSRNGHGGYSGYAIVRCNSSNLI